MTTDQLRAALHTAGIQPDQLADHLGVNPRTVRRWLNGQLPFPRHRANIARLLDTTEHALWPDIPQPAIGAATGAVGDAIVGYAFADEAGSPNPYELIAAAAVQIDLIDRSLSRPLSHPALIELLIAKGRAGTNIRIMIAEPGDHLAPLLDHPGIEIRILQAAHDRVIHRCDNELLTGLPLLAHSDPPPPLLYIRRRSPDGVFERIVADYQTAWEHLATPITMQNEIENHLHGSGPNPYEKRNERDAKTSVTIESLVSTDAPDRPGRRWPGRRD